MSGSPSCECGCPAYRHGVDGACRGTKADVCPCLQYRPIPQPGVCHCKHRIGAHDKRHPHKCTRVRCPCGAYVDSRQVLFDLGRARARA